MQGSWFEKPLSPNDIGQTGSHQAAVVISKSDYFSSQVFPELEAEKDNPEARVRFLRRDGGPGVDARFVYYNNKNRGGSRDEIRLTGITDFLRQVSPNPGDFLRLEIDSEGRHFISIRRDYSAAVSHIKARV
jgi:hypothetical protein